MKCYKMGMDGALTLETIENSQLNEGEIKVKMSCALLTTTDASVALAKPITSNIVPVSSGVAIVSDNNGQQAFERGDRVYVHTQSDPETNNTQGLLGDFRNVNVNCVHDLPNQVSDIDALFIDHVALIIQAYNELEVQKGSYLAVFGAGISGLVMCQVAQYYQSVPILISSADDRLELANSLGVYYTVNPSKENALESIAKYTAGQNCECSAYMSNTNVPFESALKATANKGKIAVVGYSEDTRSIKADISSIIAKQLTITGVCDSSKYISAAINLLANKAVKLNSSEYENVSFDAVPETFELLKKAYPQSIKKIVNFD